MSIGLVTWHGFDLLECDEGFDTDLDAWRFLGIIGAPVLGTCLLVVGPRCVRFGIVLGFLLAIGTVVAEWASKDYITTAVLPWATFQHMWLIYVVILLGHLPARSRFTRSTATLQMIDVLATRSGQRTVTEGTLPPKHTWFA